MLTLALELEGFDVGQAANGLRLISAMHVDRPDVILLDVMMSWIDGFELCRAIKKNRHLPRHPGDLHLRPQERGGRAGGLEAGAVDYFPKPLDMDRLIARIRQILDQRGTPRRPPRPRPECVKSPPRGRELHHRAVPGGALPRRRAAGRRSRRSSSAAAAAAWREALALRAHRRRQAAAAGARPRHLRGAGGRRRRRRRSPCASPWRWS